MEVQGQEIQSYKSQYEQMNSNELEQEYQLLKNKSEEEFKMRCNVVS